MTHKAVRYGAEARRALERGVDKLASAVRVTLGPKGQYVVLDQTYGAPVVTNDGVTVARQIELEDIFENQGVQLVLEVATKTNDVAGDGTTTALILAQTIVREGLKNVAAGANPLLLRGGIEKAVGAAVEAIKAQTTEVSGRDEVARVGAISARSDEIGNVIAEALDKVGKDGVVNVEEGQTLALELEFVEGMQFDKGYISPYFVTDQDRMEAILDEPYILIVSGKISNVRAMLPILNHVIRSGKPLLIVSDDLEGEALAALIVNKMRGTFNAAAVRSPLFGERRKRQLEDLAILTDGEVVTDELGLKLEDTQLDQLGRARRVVITKDDTTIIGGAGDEGHIRGRINQLKAELKGTTSDYDREKLQERLAKLEVEGVGTFEVEDGKRLVLAIEEDAGVDIMHACGSYARCTTCRVEFLEGEPEEMTQAELMVLDMRDIVGEVRLSCQAVCDRDMRVRVLMRVSGTGARDAGYPPEPEITPPPVWLDRPY